MNKTVILNVVGLTKSSLGEHTPFLCQWAREKEIKSVEPVLPAVTCSAQSSYLTGKYPEEHGIVGNGWYFKEECEIKFWRQSNRLVQGEKIWEKLKKESDQFTSANLFWWYNMYSTVDYSITPRPMYPADGRKIPDIYTYPANLRANLQKELGQFPLFKFWGPATSIDVTKWIARAAKMVDQQNNPTLTLIYLPHLDYNFQRHGPEHPSISRDLQDVDAVCKDLIQYYERQGAEVIVLSEYGITAVNHPIPINKILREQGHIEIREEMGLEILDPGASAAFAVCDHQVAHVYVRDKSEIDKLKTLFQKTQGIELVITGEERKEHHLLHARSGDLVLIADKDSWFSYYYWLDDKKAPDFARTVDIHRKPGYDPAELFIDPDIKFPKAKIGSKLLKKKLGLRTLMDVIPLKPELVKGSHGRKPESRNDWPIAISSSFKKRSDNFKAVDIFEEIYSKVIGNEV